MRRFAFWGVLLLGLVVEVCPQDALRIPVRVVVLSVSHGPEKRGEPHSAKEQRDRDQKGEDFHRDYRRRRALSETIIDEVDIAIAAESGLARPMSASGTAMVL